MGQIHPRRGLDTLNAEALKLIGAGTAGKTQETYNTAIQSYLNFASAHKLSPQPIFIQNLVFFIAQLSLENKSYNSISTYIRGISYYLKINNLQDITGSFIIKKMLEGAKRTSHKPDIRCPITPTILTQLVSGAQYGCETNYESVMFQSVFLLAFFNFLRVSEFTVNSKKDQQTWHKCIALSDIHITPGGELQLTIRFSKTDQVGKGTLLSIQKSQRGQLCPVVAMERYLAIRPPGAGPLYKHFDHAPLTKYEFTSVLKHLLSLCGIKGNIKSHSFRIGAATWCFSNNIPENQIQEMGRWAQSSNCHKRYIRMPKVDIRMST